ncbi:SH3-like domain-containing protein, partial [Oenococcus oeni]
SAYINEASRKDSIYNNGPALTSPTTLTASALAKTAPILKFGTKIIRFCVIMIKIRIGVFL